MLYFNTSQLHQSRKWYFFQKKQMVCRQSQNVLEYRDRIKVSVLGYRHRSSEVGGLLENSCLCASIVHSLLLLLSPLCFNCAFIVRPLLCSYRCCCTESRAKQVLPFCPTPVPAIANALLTIYTLHIFLLQPLSWNFYEKEKSEVSQENLSQHYHCFSCNCCNKTIGVEVSLEKKTFTCINLFYNQLGKQAENWSSCPEYGFCS